ncbi:hypothetical protein J4441_01285 [Candidatus Micrarchaeota archaeon]|nr:hypothetical protein [Candidatus Micrarchaeota archaeon]
MKKYVALFALFASLVLFYGCIAAPSAEPPVPPIGGANQTNQSNQTNPNANATVWLSYEPIQCGGNPWQIWEAESGRQYIRAPTEEEILTAYYLQVYGVEILQYQSRYTHGIVCLACSCPRGDTISIEVYEKSKAKMLSLGWSEATKPKDCPQIMPPSPNFCENGTIVSGGIDDNGCELAPACIFEPDS